MRAGGNPQATGGLDVRMLHRPRWVIKLGIVFIQLIRSIMLFTRIFSGLLLVVVSSSPTLAKDARLGDKTVVTMAPGGQCELNDTLLFTQTRGMVEAAHQILLAMYVDCRQEAAWRAKKVKYINQKSSYQAMTDYTGSPDNIVATSCKDTREQGKQYAADNVAKAKNDLGNIAKQKYDTTVFVGVLDETPDACFVGLVQKFALVDGSPIVQLTIYAILQIYHQPIFYYTFAPYTGDESVKAVLAQHKSNVAAFLAANKGG
jgi:hypothetical protein